jgi:sugar-specific transcriptional regulator TrmB
MDKVQNVYERLKSLGLSINQAELYVQLLERGDLRIHKLVELSGLPRTSVYGALRGLEDRGLIERVIGYNHVRIKPNSMESLYDEFDQKINEAQQAKVNLGILQDEISKLNFKKTKNDTEIRYFQGLMGARQLLWNSLSAESEVYVYSEWGRSKYVGEKFYEKFVSTSFDRKISEKVIINSDPVTVNLIRTAMNSPSSRTKAENIRLIDYHNIGIKGETFIYDDIYAQLYLKDGLLNGFEIENQLFANTQKSLFGNIWVTAYKFK